MSLHPVESHFLCKLDSCTEDFIHVMEKPIPKYIVLLFFPSATQEPRSCLFKPTCWHFFFPCMDRPPRMLTSCILTEFLCIMTHPQNWLTYPVLTVPGINSEIYVLPLKMDPTVILFFSEHLSLARSNFPTPATSTSQLTF